MVFNIGCRAMEALTRRENMDATNHGQPNNGTIWNMNENKTNPVEFTKNWKWFKYSSFPP